MGIVVYVIYYEVYGLLGVSKRYNIISLFVAVGLAVIVYGVLCYLFRVEEVERLVNRAKDSIKKHIK